MKPILTLASFAFASAALAQSTLPPALDGAWKKQQLTDNYWAEGATVIDVNKDGKPDVIYGPYWFAGPEFTKRHLIYPDTRRTKAKLENGSELEIEGFAGAKSMTNGYSDNFVTAAYDINADGWVDYIVMGFPGKETLWYENPQGKDVPWTKHVALDVTESESPMFVDINGDDRPDLLCMSGGYLDYASFDPKAPNDKWQWHPITPKLAFLTFTHGIGSGDVNGDGKIDILEAKGWWEQPKSLEGDPVWTKHEAPFGTGGAQMYVYDVNGDGKPDVITSLAAHAYGLAWIEQTNDGWKQHLITGTPTEKGETGIIFSQPHAIELADLNGDGVLDIVTGKRFWAHGNHGDPEPMAPAVVWWFELKRRGGTAKFVPHLIDNDSGIGTQFSVHDLNGDGKPDIIVGNKRGAFVHIQK
jgi:FG-GAP-like repeat/FG-GAP repeat